jgi:SAM-dependent methyltransferase
MASILNLGCGTRTSPHCVNLDFSIQARLRESTVGSKFARLLLNGERLERFKQLEGTIVVHDLRRGIPFDDETVDAVYHSHTLEHLDRDVVPGFFAEILRVLRPGGVHRTVVPDFEQLVRRYLAHLDHCLNEGRDWDQHDLFVGAIIEQMVRREASGSSKQRTIRRRLENLLLGDARRRGETHQWMYDRINLTAALEGAGFKDVHAVDHTHSMIPGWTDIALDLEEGREYKPGSLYIEAIK